MPGQPAPAVPGRPCSLAAALHLVGEKWALLAVREMFYGNHRFDQIVRNTGAPRDRLAARLRALEEAGIVERRRYQDRPARFEYHLTTAGQDLRAVFHGLLAWGDKWAVDAPSVSLEHDCGHELESVWICGHCGQKITGDDLTLHTLTPEWDRHGPVDREASATT